MPVAVYLALWLSALALVISVFSFFYFRSYLKRRTGHERILSELREEVDNILRSIDETTDRDISLIEEREKSLKSLLEEIDRRLRLYIRELDKRREDEEAHAALAAKTQVPSYQELGKNRHRLSGQSAAVVAAHAPPAPEPAPAAPAAVVEAPPAPESSAPLPVGERIRELTLAGFTPPVIASRLGLSIAEVEFATALMERRDAP